MNNQVKAEVRQNKNLRAFPVRAGMFGSVVELNKALVEDPLLLLDTASGVVRVTYLVGASLCSRLGCSILVPCVVHPPAVRSSWRRPRHGFSAAQGRAGDSWPDEGRLSLPLSLDRRSTGATGWPSSSTGGESPAGPPDIVPRKPSPARQGSGQVEGHTILPLGDKQLFYCDGEGWKVRI